MLMGVDPRSECQLSKIDDAIKQGEFFKDSNPADIVIGSKLAEILEVSLGDRLVVTLAQAEGGELSQNMFRISGIYSFDMKELDTGMAFIRLPVAQKMLGIGDNIHEIAIKFKDIELALQEDLPFWQKYSSNGNEAISWTKILPQLKAVFDASGISRAIMMVILGIVVIFGIINTLFMSLYERLFEFGVLRAVGTRPWGVGKLMLFEAGALGVVSVIVGLVIGGLLNLVFFNVGIDYRGIEFAGSMIQEIIYPVLKWSQFVVYPLGVFLFTFIIGLYPAIVAARMSIAEAMRKSL
jgi:ABC-type lipoprotein release transport system permease subunit